ncbi:adhesion G-protein coupled receptor G2-like [Littorina saxatilis]|uniref:Uncharacterized protein n=1 Tax=Littorina saxatilis TaxID=31220 RepID=A0AAN9ARU6_9CAEN
MEHTNHSYFLFATLVIIAHSIGDGLCLELEVRLVGPSGRGRLEVRRNESEPWGTVCNDNWDDRASNVVCFQLNLGGGTEFIDHNISTSVEIVLDEVDCTGEESNLGQCSAEQWGVHDCSNSAQIGVECEPLQDVEVRLVGGNSTKEGRVELRRSPEESWGTVCDDGWDDRDATVVCRQLGLGTTGQAKNKAFYGPGSGDIHMDNVKCRGTESNLGHCTWSSNICFHSEDAGVLCTGEDSEKVDVAVVLHVQSGTKVAEISMYLITFLKNIFKSADIDGGDMRAAFIYFNKYPTLVFNLENNQTRAALIQEMTKIWTNMPGNENDPGAALEEVRTTIFDESRGDRTDVPNAVVLITDSKANLNPHALQREASALKAAGVKIITVGIEKANEAELRSAATDAQDAFYFDNHHAALISDATAEGIRQRIYAQQEGATPSSPVTPSSATSGLPLSVTRVPTITTTPKTTTTPAPPTITTTTTTTTPTSPTTITTTTPTTTPSPPATTTSTTMTTQTTTTTRLTPPPPTTTPTTTTTPSITITTTITTTPTTTLATATPETTMTTPTTNTTAATATTSTTVMIPTTTKTTMTALTWRSKALTQPTSATPTASTPRSLTTTRALTTTGNELIESEKTGAIRNLSRANINETTLPEIVNATKAVLRENSTTSALDVILVANILENATRLSNIPIETATGLLEIVDIVAGLNQTVLEDSNTADNATNRVLQAVESLGDSVLLGESGSTRIQTNNTVLQVWNLTTVSDSHVLGLELASDSGEVTEVTEGQGRGNRSEGEEKYDNTDTAIMLPGKIGRSIIEEYPGRDIRISASIFTKTSLFRSSETVVTDADSRHRHTTLNSKVIALRITVDGQPKTNLSAFGNGSVTTVFTPVQPLSKDQAIQRERSRCVFWDFALQDGKGAWSEEGCYHSNTVQGKLVCECDHLTNFAVLLDLYGQETRKEKIAQIHESALSLISVFGLSLSIAGLSVTVISFIAIKKLHSSHPQQTLFNMALALLLAWVTFLAGFSRVHGHVSCVLVAALLHYLILVSFMWMVIEGILQYLLLVKVMVTKFSRYMLKTALPAWGLPLIPVIIILSIDVDLYSGGEHYCWMSRTPFYYAFLAPIIIMVSANIVLYVLVVVSVCRRRDMSHGGTSYTVISIRASIGCFVVLGLSWLFAFFAIEDARLVFQYLFTCTTAFQGFLIFAIFTARDPAVRQFWLDLICRRKLPRRGPRGSLPLIQSAPSRPVTKETSFNRSK